MNEPWWRGAVIYEIYTRSFCDANGDGVGDLPGVLAKLDYAASLGVDAIWIAPFFASPMADFGYDISDHCRVDPLFGEMQDFDRLLHEAHRRDLKVVVDQVLSHTSTEHAWFRESRDDRRGPRSDWYVWADAKPDGSPPNNWMSIFGGPAWRWEPRRAQYYLHNFLPSQPDLNFHNPAVRDAVLAQVRFWLDRGVDGLRLDAINFCFHDELLRDNPPKPAHLRVGRGFGADNPYAFQYHHYNNTQPENLHFLQDLRALLNRYPHVAALGEISSEDSLATMAEYLGDERLHMGYCFELLAEDFSAAHIRNTLERLEGQLRGGWPCWAFSNHDVARAVTRWGGADPPPYFASLLTALLCSLRGSACVYQGEELGLPEAALSFEQIRDPFGMAFWPAFRGRDGCRTPMPWSDEEGAGFTAGVPWLPVPQTHRALSVASQERDRASTLQQFRAFMRWRRAQPCLRWGDIRLLDSPASVLAFLRTYAGSRLFAAFNLGEAAIEAPVYEPMKLQQVEAAGVRQGSIEGDRIRLPGYSAVYARVGD